MHDVRMRRLRALTRRLERRGRRCLGCFVLAFWWHRGCGSCNLKALLSARVAVSQRSDECCNGAAMVITYEIIEEVLAQICVVVQSVCGIVEAVIRRCQPLRARGVIYNARRECSPLL